ncbi:MAG: type II toxin-antitoxin system prevent-host-death family antitoxin [Brevinematales bacterium]|jgi:prevent-host-death family protein
MDVGTFKAKTHFSELIDDVQRGIDITITKRGKPVAVLKSVELLKGKRKDIVSQILKYRITGGPAIDIKGMLEEGRR